MRNKKTIVINGKEVVVSELKTKDVIELFETEEGLETVMGLLTGSPKSYIAMFKKTARSEEPIAELCEGINGFIKLQKAFDEVNKDFLDNLPKVAEKLVKLAEDSRFLSSASTVGHKV